VQDLADTSWRINGIPMRERNRLMLSAAHPAEVAEALRRQERSLASLSMHGHRLSRQFHKTLDKLREVQALPPDRRARLKSIAAILEMHKHKGIPYDPAEDGFVFSNAPVRLAASV
jgi:hypothetical protein